MKQRTAVMSNLPNARKKARFIPFFIALPFLILVFVFSYLPLLGWVYAFFDYRPPLKLFQCDFVGFKWFTALISNSAQVGNLLRVLANTFAISGLNIITSVIPIAFAVFLMEIRVPWYKKLVQTFTTIPNFISWVLVYSFAFAIFSNDGFFNNLFTDLGLRDSPVNYLATTESVWASMVLWYLWKFMGWNAIMYIAVIIGIDQELYEAATVDGAGRFQRMWHITIPSILPTFFVLLMLSIANFLNNGMDQYYVFQNPINQNRIEVLDLYVYNIGVGNSSYSIATAIGMVKSIVSVTLLFFVNNMSRIVRGETIV